MSQEIRSIIKVSDGIIVEFDKGSNCYYSAQFLLDYREHGSNTVFFSYDPSPPMQIAPASHSGKPFSTFPETYSATLPSEKAADF